MNKLVEAFLQRCVPEGIQHQTIEIDPDEALDLDAWGNEWEADMGGEWSVPQRTPTHL
jgi:hypothetical protein